MSIYVLILQKIDSHISLKNNLAPHSHIYSKNSIPISKNVPNKKYIRNF